MATPRLATRYLPSPREQTNTPTEERAQDEMNAAVNNALQFPDTQGNIVAVKFTAAQTQDVAHKLGRAYLGWYVVRAIGASPAAIYELATQPATKLFARLKSDNALTYYIRFF